MPRGRVAIYTDEERKRKKDSNYYSYQKPKEEADWKRLEAVRIGDDYSKVTKREWKEFRKEVREKNTKRFDEIFNDEPLWKSLNTSSELWRIKKDRQNRKKKNGEYVNDKDVQRAVDVIYGGIKGDIIIIEEENDYENPYDENETNEQ